MIKKEQIGGAAVFVWVGIDNTSTGYCERRAQMLDLTGCGSGGCESGLASLGHKDSKL